MKTAIYFSFRRACILLNRKTIVASGFLSPSFQFHTSLPSSCIVKVRYFSTNKMSADLNYGVVADEDLQLARKIFNQGVQTAIPSIAVRNRISYDNTTATLRIEKKSPSSTPLLLNLDEYKTCHVIGFGKAVLPMAEELLKIVGARVDKCVLSVPKGTRLSTSSKLEMHPGAENNIPDADALRAAEKISTLVKSCTNDTLLIVLISGGGSALLPLPKSPITLDEKSSVIKNLSRAGASIFELNSVRKRISVLKGGGLVKLCPAKHIVSLILSDVLNDALDVIASGPTVKNPEDPSVALQVLNKYLKPDDIHQSILSVLQNDETTDDTIFSKVDNIIIGNNEIALQAAESLALTENCYSRVLTSTLEGDAAKLGRKIVEIALQIQLLVKENQGNKNILENLLAEMKIPNENSVGLIDDICGDNGHVKTKNFQKICLLLGGETTVNVTGTGRGGRNQEFALSSALALNAISPDGKDLGITVLCAGTDGIDGPCNAAGAVVNTQTIFDAKSQEVDAQKFLDNNDSYNFFTRVSEGAFHVMAGHTGTNVMDLIVVIIKLKSNFN